ncbi:MAG: hypothetical protein AAGG51_20250 [Cyanobacteria bacterium P01_G01_bin.54]
MPQPLQSQQPRLRHDRSSHDWAILMGWVRSLLKKKQVRTHIVSQTTVWLPSR